MKITEKTVVKLKYTLSDSSGTQIDSSEINGSLVYLHGVGMMMPGIEKVIDGQESGFTFSGTIEPEDGYGAYVQDNVTPVPRSQFEHLIDEMEEGKSYNFDVGGGKSQLLKVIKIDDDFVTVDANHPYAGETLLLECTVEGVREASEDELASLKGSGSGCGCGGHSGEKGGCCSSGDSEKESCCSSGGSEKKAGCGCSH